MSAELESELEKITKEISSIDTTIDKLSRKKQALISKKSQINEQIPKKEPEELANQACERCDYPWSNRVKEVLKSKFKLDKFRPHQLSTINAVMSGQDCILLMPPGGGKSLCYQLPAVMLDGITIVVSTSVSLIEDHIMAMEALDLPTTFLNSFNSGEQSSYIYNEMISHNPSIKFLYVTPKKLNNKDFKSKLERMYQIGQFSLLALDEAHCYSEWDCVYDPVYRFLGVMKQLFPKVPILSLTATTKTLQHFQTILKGSLVVKAPFIRPNLKYEVLYKSVSRKDNVSVIEDLLKNRFCGLSGIIYCFSVKECEKVTFELQKRGIKARAYNAQLNAGIRISVRNSWISNSTQIIVTTDAFGMGIDKSDVRFVIHYSLPESIGNFYYECEHAGRDDQPASCFIFYHLPDVFRQSTIVFTEQNGLDNLYKMVAFCLDLSRCRHSLIAQHFDEHCDTQDCNKMCDHCEKEGLYEEKLNIVSDYRRIVNILEHSSIFGKCITSQDLIKRWQGKRPSKLQPPGYLSITYTQEYCERIIGLLLLESYLKEEFHVTPDSTISYINIGTRRLPDDQKLFFPMKAVTGGNIYVNSGASSTKSIKLESSSSTTTRELPSINLQQARQSSPSSSRENLCSSIKEENSIRPLTDILQLNGKLHQHNGVMSKQNSEISSNVNVASAKKRSQNDILLSDNGNIVEGTKKAKNLF